MGRNYFEASDSKADVIEAGMESFLEEEAVLVVNDHGLRVQQHIMR